MKWFRNLKIRTKLIASFILIACFACVVGIIGFNNMKIINRRVENMYTHRFIPTLNLADVQTNLQLIRLNMYLLSFSKDESTFGSALKEMNICSQKVENILNQYKRLLHSSMERDLYTQLKNNVILYKNVRTEAINARQAGDVVKYNSMTGQVGKIRVAVDKAAGKLMNYNLEQTRKENLKNAANFKNQSLLMFVVIMIAIILAVCLGMFIANFICKPLNSLVAAAEHVANGDLNVELAINSKDEIGILAGAFQVMAENTNDVMTNITSAADQVAEGSKQVSASGISLSQGATEQASSIQELTSSLEEISVQTKQNAVNANQASEMASTAQSNAIQGNEQMQAMLLAMEGINESSSKISKIIKVIDEIAFQTNILALNAAVEAARAGQYGKGFAVVAEEVRNLAARSANAAKETTEMIESSIKKVEDGGKIANDTAVALKQIVDNVAQATKLVSEIANASNEQALGINQVNQGIAQVSQVVQNTSAISEESAAASEELSSQAQVLKEQVDRFKLKKNNNPLKKSFDKMKIDSNNSAPTNNDNAKPDKDPKIFLSESEFGKY